MGQSWQINPSPLPTATLVPNSKKNIDAQQRSNNDHPVVVASSLHRQLLGHNLHFLLYSSLAPYRKESRRLPQATLHPLPSSFAEAKSISRVSSSNPATATLSSINIAASAVVIHFESLNHKKLKYHYSSRAAHSKLSSTTAIPATIGIMFDPSNWTDTRTDKIQQEEENVGPIRGSKLYKQGLDPERGRESRREQTLKIRKDKKQQVLKKRRGIDGSNDQDYDEDEYTPQDYQDILYYFMTAVEGDHRLASTQDLRSILKTSSESALTAMLAHGNPLPRLVEYLDPNHAPPALISESLWSIANLAALPDTQEMFSIGAVQGVVYHLQNSNNVNDKDSCIVALTNIASDGGNLRQAILSMGALEVL
jgi:Importin beta binding domain